MGERTLNARQLQVMEWILAGCPDGVMTGTTHKVTAVALQSRRLVKVSRRGGVWRAEPTEAGRFFVEHGAYPAGHWAGGTRPAPRPAASAAMPKTVGERKVTGLRPVDQMMADLAEAGGELRVAAEAGSYWENLATSATHHGKVPQGKTLKITRGKDWSERIIRLEDAPVLMTLEVKPISVAASLRSPHPVVRALRDDKDQLPITGRVRWRALRILDAVAEAAAARGYRVTAPKAKPGSRRPKGHLVLTIGRHPNTLILDQLDDRVPHQPTKHELERRGRYSWATIPTHDLVPSDRLRIRLERGWKVRRDVFADTKTITVEDRLPQLLQELELRAAVAEDQAQRREREAEERKRRWQQVREDAIVHAREHHRAKVLMDQVERWHEGKRLGAYLDAMQTRVAALDSAEQQEAEKWLAWARQHRDRIDPLRRALWLPTDPEFGPEVIAPFMRGWSPHGPTAHQPL